MIIKNELGFSKIIRKDIGETPDFVMERNGKEVKVELETLSSNFSLHGHSLNKVDELFCLIKDEDLKLPITEIKGLKFEGKSRISATVNPETEKFLEEMVKKRKYRNLSHAIEEAIRFFKKNAEGEK